MQTWAHLQSLESWKAYWLYILMTKLWRILIQSSQSRMHTIWKRWWYLARVKVKPSFGAQRLPSRKEMLWGIFFQVHKLLHFDFTQTQKVWEWEVHNDEFINFSMLSTLCLWLSNFQKCNWNDGSTIMVLHVSKIWFSVNVPQTKPGWVKAYILKNLIRFIRCSIHILNLFILNGGGVD